MSDELLNRIHTPEDIRALHRDELPQLCGELREFFIHHVAETGGHLASNLGVVELTVAIHRVFDTKRDRLVFDVGHQCYVHKILTGRRDGFVKLRQLDGLSGFPKPRESIHDAFVAGHASNSVSVALGMARARTLLDENYSVLALIGDGALTGGLAYEGLNDAGASGEPLIVILNDNGMSINPNVGAMTRHLARLRNKPAYYQFKKWYRQLFGQNPLENRFYRGLHKLKTTLKNTIWPGSTLFENMGFTYLGPVDGHDLDSLCHVLEWARELQCPVLVHVHTVKGKGYVFAERNPEKFHGVAPFDPETGLLRQSPGPTFSSVFGETLSRFAAENPKVCAITAAVGEGVGLGDFARRYPERFFDAAIAEGHAVAMAAGMAKQGLIPVFAVYSTFLQRGYDQLIHDVSLQKLHVVLAVDRAGLVGADGETHHGCLDVQYISGIPGFTLLCPSNFAELRQMLAQALFHMNTPVAIRYPRGGEGHFTRDTSSQTFLRVFASQSNPETDNSQNDSPNPENIVLVGYGIRINALLDAADILKQRKIAVQVYKCNQITPLPVQEITEAFENLNNLLLVTAEDSFYEGNLGTRLAGLLAEQGKSCRLLALTLGNTYAPEGSVSELERRFGLDAQSVADRVCAEIGQII